MIENEHLLFRASRDQSLSAVLTAKDGVNEKAAVPITIVGRGPKSTGPVSIGIVSLSDESATIAYGAEGAGGPKVECWLASGKHSVEIKPVAKADRLAIGVKSQFLVVPSEFGEDLLCDALKCNIGQTYPLPSEKLVLALECDGNFMTVLTYPSIDQAGTATVGPGDGVQNHGHALDSQVTSVTGKFNGKSLFVGLLPQKDNWYYEPVNKKYSASGQYNIPWQPPYPGVWRTVGRVNGRYFSSDVPDERFVFACSLSGSLDCLFAYFDGSAGNRTIASPTTIYREMLERTGKSDPSSQAEDERQGQQLMRRKTKYRDVCNSADDMKETWRNRADTLTRDPDHVAGLLADCKAIIERMDRRLAEYQALIQHLGAVAAEIKQKAGGKEAADLRTFAAAVTRSQAKLKAIKMVPAAPGLEAADKIRTKLGRAQGGRLDVGELDRIAESMREVANKQEVHLKKLREATLQLAQVCTKQRKTMSPGLKPYVSEVGSELPQSASHTRSGGMTTVMTTVATSVSPLACKPRPRGRLPLYWAAAGMIVCAGCGHVAVSTPSQPQPEIVKTKNGIEMVRLPAGAFTVVSEPAAAKEAPPPNVHVDSILMDRYEVTQEEYEKLVIGNPSKFKDPKSPVERVRWVEAALYCNGRSSAEGLKPCYDENTFACNFDANGYRLPTEAEWEFACRAGADGEYWFGSDAGHLGDYAWFHDNSSDRTHPVGTKKPNPWGLYDMYGNVGEWCQDVYDEKFDPARPLSKTIVSKAGAKRVVRGGSWGSGATKCRSSSRAGESPGSFADACFARADIGFRCVRRAPSPGSAAAVAERSESQPAAFRP